MKLLCRALFFFAVLFPIHSAFPIAGGVIEPGVSPVGYIFEGFFQNGKLWGDIPICTGVRVVSPQHAVTNSHCFYKYVGLDGKFTIVKDKQLFITFADEIGPEGPHFRITKVIHQIAPLGSPRRKFWDDYYETSSDDSEVNLNTVFTTLKSDLAIIEFERDSRDANPVVSPILPYQVPPPPKDKPEYRVVGYGHSDITENRKDAGTRRALAVQPVKYKGAAIQHAGAALLRSPLEGPTAGDSGAFVGTRDDQMIGLAVTRALSTDHTQKYFFLFRSFDSADIRWIEKGIKELEALPTTRGIRLLYRPQFNN